MISTTLIYCEVLASHLKATGLHDLFDINPKNLSSNEMIQTLNTKFRYLKAQVLLIPYEGKKLDTEGEMYGIKMDMNKLVESQKMG